MMENRVQLDIYFHPQDRRNKVYAYNFQLNQIKRHSMFSRNEFVLIHFE